MKIFVLLHPSKLKTNIMKKTILSVILICIFSLCFSQNIVAPSVWLRADSAVLGAASWRDVSGNGFDATPSSGAMPSAFSRMNFNKCFEVNGETFTLPLGINDTKRSDVIVVYETYDTLGENALWQIDIDSAKRIGQTTHRILNGNGQITYDTANRLKPVVNYLAQSWYEQDVCAPTLTLCAADSLTLSGRIAEALYFDRRISDTAVIQWISYLALKYGVTLAQTNYLDSRRNVIWDYTDYPDYNTSIAGLGRDDSVGLNQKQTYYADGQIIFGVNQLAQTNEDNAATIADGDFIVFGMEGVLPAVSEIYTQSGETYEVIGRSMAQVTGNARTYGTFILLDTAAVQDGIAPDLLVDRSGTGEFPAGEIEQIHSVGTDSAGHYIYSNVHWDTDQSGRDFFCFAVTMPDTAQTKAMAVNAGNGNGTTLDNVDAKSARANDYSSLQATNNETDMKNAQTSAPQFRLLPNPNHGNFTVEIAYPEAQDVTVTVYDSDGRLLLTMEGRGQRSYHFEGALQTAGHYLIDIASPSEHQTLKMVVN